MPKRRHSKCAFRRATKTWSLYLISIKFGGMVCLSLIFSLLLSGKRLWSVVIDDAMHQEFRQTDGRKGQVEEETCFWPDFQPVLPDAYWCLVQFPPLGNHLTPIKGEGKEAGWGTGERKRDDSVSTLGKNLLDEMRGQLG